MSPFTGQNLHVHQKSFSTNGLARTRTKPQLLGRHGSDKMQKKARCSPLLVFCRWSLEAFWFGTTPQMCGALIQLNGKRPFKHTHIHSIVLLTLIAIELIVGGNEMPVRVQCNVALHHGDLLSFSSFRSFPARILQCNTLLKFLRRERVYPSA